MKSKLADITILSPNYNKGRTSEFNTSGDITKITIHHAAGICTAEGLAKIFQSPERQASCNYAIGNDGKIACVVEEENRSWCSGSPWNDYKAITIEVSNDINREPWSVSKAAYNSLIRLCADICKRYSFGLDFTGDSSGSLTAHRMFQATACPGDYLYSRFAKIAEDVNDILKDNRKKTYNKVEDVPEWVRGTIKSYVEKGIIRGNENGLDLSYNDLRLIEILERRLKK